MRTERIAYIVAIAILTFILFIRACSNPIEIEDPEQVTVWDTITQVQNDTVIQLVPRYIMRVDTLRDTIIKELYVSTIDTVISLPDASEGEIEGFLGELYQNGRLEVVHSDTIEDNNLAMWYKAYVQGNFNGINIQYKLKPQPVRTRYVTKEVEVPQYGRTMFLTGHAGFSGISPRLGVGLNYVHKDKYTFGYRVDFLDQSHSLEFGVPIKKWN